MGDQIPGWASALLQNQQAQLQQMAQFVQQNQQAQLQFMQQLPQAFAAAQQPPEARPLRSEYIYKFQPSDSPDDIDYYLFTERISDLVMQFGEPKVLASLVVCLENARAKTWYTSLADHDKALLRTSTHSWKTILKRDFGIKPFRAKQLAQREVFSFSQQRPVLQYFDKKIACLKIAGVKDEDMQCSEIKDGLQDPEYRSAIRLEPGGNMLTMIRQDLIDNEDDCRAIWDKSQCLQRLIASRAPPVIPKPPMPINPLPPAPQRPVLQYFDKKIACLKIAGVKDEDMQCSEIKDGLQDPEYRSAIRLEPGGNTLTMIRQDLIDNEDDCRAIWDKSQRLQRLIASRAPPVIPKPPMPINPLPPAPQERDIRVAEDRRGRGIWKGRGRVPYGEAVAPRGGQRPSNGGKGGYKEPLAITANASKVPPRPCRFCGGQHWDRECSYYKPAATAYHCYRVDISEDEFEKAEQEYDVLQTEVLTLSENQDSNQDEDYQDLHDDPEPPIFMATTTSPTRLASTKASSVAEKSDAHAMGQIYLVSEQNSPAPQKQIPLSKPHSPTYKCQNCAQMFTSRNRLFEHLKQTNHFEDPKVENDPTAITVVPSTAAVHGVGSGYSFRDYNYCEIRYVLSCKTDGKPDYQKADYGCLDSGGGMSLIDEDILATLPWQKRKRLKEPVTVKGMKGKPLDASEVVVLTVYFPDASGQRFAQVQREFHIVQGLDCGILFGNDVIAPENIVIDVANRKATIRACNDFVCPLRVTPRRKIKGVTVRTAAKAIIPPNSYTFIPIRHARTSSQAWEQDLVFEPTRGNAHLPSGAYAMRSIFHGDQRSVLIINVSNEEITVLKGVRIGSMGSLHNATETQLWPEATQELSVYFTNSSHSPSNSPHSPEIPPDKVQKQTYVPQFVANVIRQTKDKIFSKDLKGSAAVQVNADDDITPAQIKALRDVLRNYEALFSDKLGLAKEPEKDWLRIPLQPGTEKEIKPLRMYRLGPKEKEIVDKVFDEQRQEGRLVDASGTPAGWPVFVAKSGQKWRPVVDLRALNKYIVPDAYPLPRQDDIIAALRGKYWISIFDIRSAYYQRRVHPDDWWKLAISTHRGHEQFTVTPMGLSISVAHQQKYMDRLLRKFSWRVVCCFIAHNCIRMNVQMSKPNQTSK